MKITIKEPGLYTIGKNLRFQHVEDETLDQGLREIVASSLGDEAILSLRGDPTVARYEQMAREHDRAALEQAGLTTKEATTWKKEPVLRMWRTVQQEGTEQKQSLEVPIFIAEHGGGWEAAHVMVKTKITGSDGSWILAELSTSDLVERTEAEGDSLGFVPDDQNYRMSI